MIKLFLADVDGNDDIEAYDREIKAWLPATVLEPSCLRNVYWVRTHYPDGTALERPRNKLMLRILNEGYLAKKIRSFRLWWFYRS